MTLEKYRLLRDAIIGAGYKHDIEWAETIVPIEQLDAQQFWMEYAWVVINSGMKNQVARGIWDRVRPVVERGGSASEVFKHIGKAAAIDRVWKSRRTLFYHYKLAADKMEFLRRLPWIGPITCWHLAKNFGADVAKPDRHLERIAGAGRTHELCARLSKESGDAVRVVDTVIWRAANLGLA